MTQRIPGQVPATRPHAASTRRLWLRPVVALGSAAALAAAVTAAILPAAQAAATAPATATIRVTAVTKATVKVPFGIVETDVVENGAARIVGAASLICRGTGPTSPPHCAATLDLSRGDLFFTVTGTKSGAAGRLAKGTGSYAGMRGSIVATSESATKTRLVIKLHK